MGEDERFPPPPDDGGIEPETGVGAGEFVVEGFSDDESQRSADVDVPPDAMEGDERDSDSTAELEYGAAPTDPEELHLEPAAPDGGFDGWLDDPAERPDPYSDLGGDEEADEIADWMAFTRGDDSAEPLAEPEPVVATGSERDDAGTADVEAEPESAEPESTMVPEADAASVEPVSEVTGEAADDPTDPGAVEAIAESDDDEDGAEDDVLSWEDARTLEEADTGELDLWVSDVPEGTDSPDTDTDLGPGEVASAGEVFDFDDFTEESYVQTATTEHAGLAAHIARAATEDAEQVPLAAAMPGVETGTVGFEDVVGEDASQIVTPPSRGGSELALRVGSGIALVALVVVSLLWAPAMAVLAGVVFLIAGWEFYAALISRRYHPLSLFGLLGIAGASIGAYFDGSGAIPIALVLTVAAALLFDAVAPRKDQPAVNFALTILVAAWISLGAFAFDIINAADYQILVGAIVAIVALVDIAQYFVGRSFGRRQLAPVISPKKTIEGLMGGVVTALILGAALSFVAPFDLGSGLLIGAVVALFAPLGDLAVSGVKRSLDIKDMGSIVPGHGGILDRIDALLFVIPAAWAAYTWLGLL